MELKSTIELMNSADYRERFKAEYYQTKIRYEKLKDFNTRIKVARAMQYTDKAEAFKEPVHDCPADMLREQQKIMGKYLHILEMRAKIEGIAL